MAENFAVSSLIVPGTYIRVRAEGLISVGGIPTGNIGIIGTARKQSLDEEGKPVVDGDGDPVFEDIYNQTYTLSDYASAREALGTYDAYATHKLNLVRAIELLFQNGARTIYARPLALQTNGSQPGQAAYISAFNELAKDDVNIILAPQLSTNDAKAVLGSVLETAEENGKDMIAVIGSDATTKAGIIGQVAVNDRVIMTTPGIQANETLTETDADGDVTTTSNDVTLSGTYSAAPIAGLLSTLAPQSSPTNKTLSALTKLSQRFSYSDVKDLINGGLMVLEERRGIRVVRGITTEMSTGGPFKYVTTRRITDFAKAGIRKASDPFIGKLNNERVRKALRGAIDGFLTTMVQDEALISYELQVTATRQDEISGRAIVSAILQPTFSIDFVAVTLVIQ